MLAIVSGGLVFACTCGPAPSPESQLLENFFRAARVRDTTILAGLSAVLFEPRTEGSVQKFAIRAVGDEQHLDGTVSKEVAIDAQVRTPQGEVVPRSFVVTLQRGVGPRPDRWFITAITPPPASRTSPAASSAPPS